MRYAPCFGRWAPAFGRKNNAARTHSINSDNMLDLEDGINEIFSEYEHIQTYYKELTYCGNRRSSNVWEDKGTDTEAALFNAGTAILRAALREEKAIHKSALRKQMRARYKEAESASNLARYHANMADPDFRQTLRDRSRRRYRNDMADPSRREARRLCYHAAMADPAKKARIRQQQRDRYAISKTIRADGRRSATEPQRENK